MRVVIAHGMTKEKAIPAMHDGLKRMVVAVAGPVSVTDPQKRWHGSVMHFSFRGRLGFLSLPLRGTIEVDHVNVIVDMEQPGITKAMISERTLRGLIHGSVTDLLREHRAGSGRL